MNIPFQGCQQTKSNHSWPSLLLVGLQDLLFPSFFRRQIDDRLGCLHRPRSWWLTPSWLPRPRATFGPACVARSPVRSSRCLRCTALRFSDGTARSGPVPVGTKWCSFPSLCPWRMFSVTGEQQEAGSEVFLALVLLRVLS